MTLTEKILARAAGKDCVQAGDNVWVKADVLMTHDVCGPGTIGVFKREFGQNAKVWDRNKVVIIPDHYIFTADSKSNRNVDILRDFVKELPDAAIEVHLQQAEKTPSELSLMHLYPINGAVHRVGSGDTAWSCRDATWSMVIAGIDPDPQKQAQ